MKSIASMLQTADNHVELLFEAKNSGRIIVGYLANGYAPEEMILASGAYPVALNRGGDSEPVLLSISRVGRYVDTFCKAQVGYPMIDEPLYQIPDLVVIPVTDQHVRAIADAWAFYVDVDLFRLGVPHSKTPHGYSYYCSQLSVFKERLEKLTKLKITDDSLFALMAETNQINRLLKQISWSRSEKNPRLAGGQFIRMLHYSSLISRQRLIPLLESVLAEIRKSAAKTRPGKPRILLTGSTLARGDYNILDILETSGADVVFEEFTEGLRDYSQDFSLDGDPLQSLCDCYFRNKLPGAFFRDSVNERFNFLSERIAEFNPDGIVWYSLLYRDTYDQEAFLFEKEMADRKIPFMHLKSDYDAGEKGSLKTKIETFIDTL